MGNTKVLKWGAAAEFLKNHSKLVCSLPLQQCSQSSVPHQSSSNDITDIIHVSLQTISVLSGPCLEVQWVTAKASDWRQRHVNDVRDVIAAGPLGNTGAVAALEGHNFLKTQDNPL